MTHSSTAGAVRTKLSGPCTSSPPAMETMPTPCARLMAIMTITTYFLAVGRPRSSVSSALVAEFWAAQDRREGYTHDCIHG